MLMTEQELQNYQQRQAGFKQQGGKSCTGSRERHIAHGNPRAAQNKRLKGVKMNIIAVDPGQKGGIAFVGEKGNTVYPMPETVKGIVDLIQNTSYAKNCMLVVERAQAMPKQGVTGVFTYGQHYGTFEAIAACLGMPFVSIPPREWKKAMGLNSDKTSSIIEAERLFPGSDLLPTPRCKKPSDGMAEALLIGEYARRKFNF